MFKFRYLIIIIIITLIGFLLSIKGWLWPVKDNFYKIISPISIGIEQTVFKVRDFFNAFVQINSLEQENKKITQENNELLAKFIHLQDVERENLLLKEELGFSKKDNLQFIPSQIINRSAFSQTNILTVNKGENDGVVEGAAAVSSGFLIGQAIQVSQDISQIQTIIDSTSKIPVVLSRSRGTGILKGGLEGLVIEEIPLDINIEKGEDVLTSGLGGTLPVGLPIGQIDEILPSKGEIFQKVKVLSKITFSRLEIIFVVKK